MDLGYTSSYLVYLFFYAVKHVLFNNLENCRIYTNIVRIDTNKKTSISTIE